MSAATVISNPTQEAYMPNIAERDARERSDRERRKRARTQAAATYIADRDGELEQIATYDTPAGTHRVCINYHQALDWRVIDVDPEGHATPVDRLDDRDDDDDHRIADRAARKPTAEALAERHALDMRVAQLKETLDAAALIYDATEHGGLDQVATYTGPEGKQSVCVNFHPDLDWRVIDVAPDSSAVLVDRLNGNDDLKKHAVMLAKDYAQQSRRYHAGERADAPIGRPASMQMRYRKRSS